MRCEYRTPVIPVTVETRRPGLFGTSVRVHDRLVSLPLFESGRQKHQAVNYSVILRTLPGDLLLGPELPGCDLRIRIRQNSFLSVRRYKDFIPFRPEL
jgi:hypothetical protein